MTFSIKPALYGLDYHQINDLLLADNFHSNIASWLRTIDHFPIEKGSSSNASTGLLMFERFSPWSDGWCSDYTTKLYQLYKYLSESSYYQRSYFNGYGLLDTEYGDILQNEPSYNFNIPPSITLSNPTDKLISVTYLQRSYTDSYVYFFGISRLVDIYIKRVIRIPPLSNVILSTEKILCCSMVVNAVDNLTPIEVGIISGLDYLDWDKHLDDIKDIINDNYPYLHQRINHIDYKIVCRSGAQHDTTTGNLIADLIYTLEWIPGSLILGSVRDWFYSACLIYANNDYWNSGEPLKDDLGKELNVVVQSSSLLYDFLYIPTVNGITSNLIQQPILPATMPPYSNIGVEILEFCYRPGVGVHTISTSISSSQFSDPRTRFRESDSVTISYPGIPPQGGETAYRVIRRYIGLNAYTNSGICPQIHPILFSEVDGIISVYNSLLIETYQDQDDSDPEEIINTWTTAHGISRFVYNGFYDVSSREFTLTSQLELQQKTTEYSVTIPHEPPFSNFPFTGFAQSVVVRGGSYDSENSVSSYFIKDHQRSSEDYEVVKTLSFSTHVTDPRTIRSNTNQEIIQAVNTIIIASYNENNFMVDSTRIIEIHEALDAGKFANDPNDSAVRRFANLGYYVERIARVLGISVDPDGSIRSVRQRAFLDSGETIPAGWPIGQWGRNQGEDPDGQQGGNIEDDKDGLTYPVISNKFTLDEFTGAPDKITEGGYVLCENLIQYLETFKDDLDKALGLQSAGANSFPRPQGDGDVSYEGLSVLIQENTYMISQLSRLISSAQISSLVTQAITTELLAHCGVPTTIKELRVNVGENETVSIPYPAITSQSPSQFDQTLLLLSNLAPLLGGKITIRSDRRNEGAE